MARPTLLLTVFLTLMLLAPPPPQAAAEGPGPEVGAHEITVRFDIERHRLVAEDVIRVTTDRATTLRLDLAPELEILEARVADGVVNVDRRPDGRFSVAVPAGDSEVRLRYAGVVNDAVKAADDLTWVVGDDTRGVIGTPGIYLAPSSRWIPIVRDGGLTHYHLTAYTPAPFVAASQGSVPRRWEVRGAAEVHAGDELRPEGSTPFGGTSLATWNASEHRSVLPTDGLYLSAGPFEVQSREVLGVTLSTYFLPEHADAAPLWLDSAEATVRRYAPLLGDYPHPKFDVVENFFQSGYGMPSYTLLGDRVIAYVTAKAQRSGGKIPPGYLDHEYVHGWFGNGLFVDYPSGNWCEALTTYYSNYLAVELDDGEDAARDYRRGVMEKFAIRVNPENDFPLRQFTQKREDSDNDIGYGKGSLVFHLIRKAIGDETFFDAVRSFTQAHVGTVVSWDDWIDVFEQASGKELADDIEPWLSRTGLPHLRLGAVEGGGTDAPVRAEVKQDAEDGPAWPTPVELRIDGKDGRSETLRAWMRDGAAAVVLEGPTGLAPHVIRLDPDAHVLRRIPDGELPACLNRTLEAEDGVVVVKTDVEALQGLAQQLHRSKGLRIVDADFDLAAHAGPAVVLEVAEGPLVAGGRSWEGDDVSVLESSARDGRLRTVYRAASPAAAARAGYVPFYGWDTFLVFRGGRPVERRVVRPDAPSAVRDLLAAAAATRIADDVAWLAGEVAPQRRPLAEGHEDLAGLLQSRLLSCAGGPRAETLLLPFEIGVADRLSDRTIRILSDPPVPLADAFRPFAFSPSRTEPWTLPIAHDAQGVGLRIEELQGEDPVEALLALWTRHLGTARPADALAVVLTPEQEAALAPWLDVPSDLTASSEADLARPDRHGRARARPSLAPILSSAIRSSRPPRSTVAIQTAR